MARITYTLASIALALVTGVSQIFAYDLVVFFVVDQLRSEAVSFKPPNGVFFPNTYLPYSCTLTAPGHATLLSGRLPREHGIIANSWFEGDKLIMAGEDTSTSPIGGKIGFSPHQFIGDHLSLYWKRRYPQSYFISISHKERSAVFSGGPAADLAIWASAAGFASSSYYPKADKKIVEILNKASAQTTGNKARSPDQKTLAAAKFLAKYFSLGKKEEPDFLAVSLSELDIIAHKHGYEHRKTQEHLQKLPKALQDFESYMRKTLKIHNILFVLTADHGSTTIEKEAIVYSATPKRISPEELYAPLGQYRIPWKTIPPHIYSEEEALALALAESPYVYRIYLPQRRQFVRPPHLPTAMLPPDSELENLLQACYFPSRSPNILVVLWPYIFLQDKGSDVVAGHGGPFPSDRRIPFLLWGDGFSHSITIEKETSALAIAKTVAHLVGVTYPHPEHLAPLLPEKRGKIQRD
ncbi:MAG: alkaline phosphatase family protein [Leptospiraceae bacterium]|nr:alkaline phosphatase family protein [Leptospiraceae bacterium]